MKKILIVLTLLSTAAFAQVNVKGATVDATQGYTFGGAAPTNHVLCGNGTRYVDAASCGTVATVFYQFVQANGSGLTQRSTLNFDSNFAPADTSPSTTIHLASTISSNTSGNAATATNANAVGGVGIGGLCQTGGTGCPGATYTGASGFQRLGASGLVLAWMTGASQSDVSSGAGNSPQTLSIPAGACPIGVLFVQTTALVPAETMGDDTHGPEEVTVSFTGNTVTTQRYRLADHGSDPSAPLVYVICH